jgi:transketolase
MRKTCLNEIYALAQQEEKVFFIGSDLGVDTLKEFKENIPDRFFMEGISEANVIGMASGLAMEGKIVYVNTIGTFLTRRCFEQIVVDMCLHNVNVRLIGNGGGLVYAPLGPTHEIIEDLAILRSIPNMSIVAPADADEMKRLIPLTLNYPGPLYVRLGKGFDPIVSRNDLPFEIGKAIPMMKGKDALVVTTGITLQPALEAAELLRQEGIKISILHMHTIKPLDTITLLEYAADVDVIITMEEHTILGGLGGAVAEVILEKNFAQPKRFKRIGIPDMFADEYGSQASLMKRFGITSENLISTIKQLRI